MKWHLFFIASAFAAGVLTNEAAGHDYQVGDLVIEHPWMMQPPRMAEVARGALSIRNRGQADDTLVKATVEIAAATEIHSMTMANGVMTMRAVNAVPVPAGQSVSIEGDLHLMLTGLKRRPDVGEKIRGQLVFEKAGTLEVEFLVEPISMKRSHPGHGLSKTK